ncbi:MAG: FadR family transcriptional regulator [Gammaproteobacteria bacterium]|nr:FadR family transcriptional regulator [Gammaproteobacteria bacterium]
MAVLERNNNLSQRMTQELGKLIVCGEYSQQNGLPSEAELCEQYGVSRTAVREAVKMLTAKGLISSRPRQGIRVMDEEEWNILDSDVLKWSLEGTPTLAVLKEYLQMRIAIEPEAASLAARFGTDEKIAAIESALNRMAEAVESGNKEAELAADIDFHIGILYASENRFYIHMRDFTRTALNASVRSTSQIKGGTNDLIEDHGKVLNAIKARNPERAKNSMFLLIDEALTFIEQKLMEQQ